MRIEEAMVHLERAINTGGSRAQGAQLVIQVQSPGSAGATPCVPVEAVVSGIDWDAGKILLVPEQPLSVAASGVEPPYPTEVEPLIRLSDYEALQAEYDRLAQYYKNGIECFANPCEKHSGENTPPFSEFFERYGGQCLICVVDNNKALQAEYRILEALVKALELFVSNPTPTSEDFDMARKTLSAYRKQGDE